MEIQSQTKIRASLDTGALYKKLQPIENVRADLPGVLILRNLDQNLIEQEFNYELNTESPLEQELKGIIQKVYKEILASLGLDENSIQDAAYYCHHTKDYESSKSTTWHLDDLDSGFYFCVIAIQEVGHLEVVDGPLHVPDVYGEDIHTQWDKLTKDAIAAGAVKVNQVPFGEVCYLTKNDMHQRGNFSEEGFRHCFWIVPKAA